MDLQTRKIEFIQEFLKLQREEIIAKLEKLLKTEKTNEVKAFSEQLNARINASLKDSENDKVINSNDLLSEIKTWQ